MTMEVRPIDAVTLDAWLDNLIYETCDQMCRRQAAFIQRAINDEKRFPTIDFNVHARWLMRDDGEGLHRVCSRCGKESKEEKPFCAECGARMDGGKDNV